MPDRNIELWGGTLGGTVLAIINSFLLVPASQIISTIVLSAVGATVSFLVSFLLKLIIRLIRKIHASASEKKHA